MKEELVEFEGTVTELLRGGMFRVEIAESKHEVIAQINGKMRMYKIKKETKIKKKTKIKEK